MAIVSHCLSGKHDHPRRGDAGRAAATCWAPAIHCGCGCGWLVTVLIDRDACTCGAPWDVGDHRVAAASALVRLLGMAHADLYDSPERRELTAAVATLLGVPLVS